uniref:MutS protein homolog 5-like isoform X1 n=1 Tax=Diabrotica virgifera virgifera TaxID=50390 RepID=A0A6P7H1Z0_DIAVI
MSQIADEIFKKIEMKFENRLKSVENEVLTLKQELKKVKSENTQLKMAVDNSEQFSRNQNIRIFGLEVSENENLKEKVCTLFKSKLKLSTFSDKDIKNSFRVAAKNPTNDKPPAVLVQLVDVNKHSEILKCRKLLKHTNIVIKEDLTKYRVQLLNSAVQKFSSKSAFCLNGNIYVKSGGSIIRVQNEKDILDIPVDASLIAIAITASCKMYIRPFLNTNNYFQLDECRHPLLEHMLDQFQPNDFYSGANNSHIKIITGPNGSGKSVYLKQICLVVYLAHVGSYVPCSRADINLLDTIHSRVLAMESAVVRLSSFMIDVTQMNNTLTDPAASSLVLIDEFGKGTSETEGICLLQGALEHFLDRGDACPHVLVSTHFQQIHKRLPDSPLVQYQKMEHTKESGVLYFLYKISEGISNSYAFDVAEEIGIDKKTIDRAKEIFDCLSNSKPLAPLPQLLARNKFDMTTLQILDIPEPDEGSEITNINLHELLR